MNKQATDLFGGPQELAHRIAGGIGLQTLDGEGALAVVQRLQRHDVLKIFESRNQPLDSIMSIKWTDEDREYWKARMQSGTRTTMVSEGGATPNLDIALEIYVRMEALGAVCSSEPEDRISTPDIESLRRKYRPLAQSSLSAG